jgi:hypothetical protein
VSRINLGLRSKNVYEAIAMLEAINASWTPEYHDIKALVVGIFLLADRRVGRTPIGASITDSLAHDFTASVTLTESLRHDGGWELQILQPRGCCRTRAGEDMTRSRQISENFVQTTCLRFNSFPWPPRSRQAETSPPFLFNSKYINRREKFLSSTN